MHYLHQGALKNKMTDLDVIGWFLGGQKRKVEYFLLITFVLLFFTPLTEKHLKTR
jgi:hypothetical protein